MKLKKESSYLPHTYFPAVKERHFGRDFNVLMQAVRMWSNTGYRYGAAENGCDVLYIGKSRHPEAEAVLSLSEKVHLISTQQDLDTLPPLAQVFVTNQTTMSILILKHCLRQYVNGIRRLSSVRKSVTQPVYASRQLPIWKDKQIDVLYVVGDRYSNNSTGLRRLPVIRHSSGISDWWCQWYSGWADMQCRTCGGNLGASTPTYLTAQVIAYLEDYAPGNVSRR